MPRSGLDYALPHAVLALLQEENSPPCPKSYYISSSTKSTKITLIYTRSKRHVFKNAKKKCKTNNSDYDSRTSSCTDDYSQLPGSVQTTPGAKSTPGKHKIRRICASTPGRGYGDAARVREHQGSNTAAKIRTDPMQCSSCKDHLSINHFTIDHEHHSDSDDILNQYVALSPCSGNSERPPTPGRDFIMSKSPRPPTPNVTNNRMNCSSWVNKDLLHPQDTAHQSPSRQQTLEYDEVDLSPPPTPCIRRTNDIVGSEGRAKNTKNMTNQNHASKTVTNSIKIRAEPPPITVSYSSP